MHNTSILRARIIPIIYYNRGQLDKRPMSSGPKSNKINYMQTLKMENSPNFIRKIFFFYFSLVYLYIHIYIFKIVIILKQTNEIWIRLIGIIEKKK